MERKNSLQQAIRTDLEVFAVLEETLRTLKQWMCFDCMSIQAWTRACKHGDTDLKPAALDGDVIQTILGVSRPSRVPL